MSKSMGSTGRRRLLQAITLGEVFSNIGVALLVLKRNPSSDTTPLIAIIAILLSFATSSLVCASLVQRAFQDPASVAVIGLGYLHCANLGMLVLNLSTGLLRPLIDNLTVKPEILTTFRFVVCCAGVLIACRARASPAARILLITSTCLGQAWLTGQELIVAVFLVALGMVVHGIAARFEPALRRMILLFPVSLTACVTAAAVLVYTRTLNVFITACVLVAIFIATYTHHINHQLEVAHTKGVTHAHI